MSAEILIHLLRGLAWLGENFPDNPRLGRKLLLIGGVLVSTVFVPSTSPDWGDLILIFKSLSVITGGVCLILGALIFFRRWVWRHQDSRPPVITSLKWK